MVDLLTLFTVGHVFETSFVVEPDDTVGNFSPHMATLLSTPAVATRLTRFSRDFCDTGLPEGCITVGCSMSIEHLSTVMLGVRLRMTAIVTSVEGNRIRLDCQIADDLGPVVRCHIERAVVLHCALAEQAAQRTKALTEQRS